MPVEPVGHLDAHDVFGLLVAELALDPQPQRRAMGDRQRPRRSGMGQDGLGMEGVDQVDALVVVARAVGACFVHVGAMEDA